MARQRSASEASGFELGPCEASWLLLRRRGASEVSCGVVHPRQAAVAPAARRIRGEQRLRRPEQRRTTSTMSTAAQVAVSGSHPTPPNGIRSVGNELISLSLCVSISLSFDPNTGYDFHVASYSYPRPYFPQSNRHLHGHRSLTHTVTQRRVSSTRIHLPRASSPRRPSAYSARAAVAVGGPRTQQYMEDPGVPAHCGTVSPRPDRVGFRGLHRLEFLWIAKIPRDLTEASLSGAGLSIVAALAMVFLFGMELSSYLAVNTTTSVIVDRSSDGEFLRIDFNISFPALSCEFASVDVSDVLGTNRLNITKTVRKYSIDRNFVPTGSEFHPGPIPTVNKHGDDVEEDHVDGAFSLSSHNFDSFSHQYPVLVVNFYAPWCYWSNRLKPSWEKTAKIMRERYDPEMDGRILLGKVDCTEEVDLCRRHHIQGYPSIRVFRKGSDIKENQGHHDHESYYGERDTESLIAAMETYVANIPKALALEDKSNKTVDPAKRPAPMASGCRIEGFVRVKRVPGSVVISARSGSHSFDPSQINVSHYVTQFSFGKRLSPRMLHEFIRLTPYLRGYHDRLAGQSYTVKHGEVNANVTIEHYLQVVKTELVTQRFSKELKVLEEYEYTAHSNLVHSFYVPVVKFHFEPSPMQVLVTEVPRSFSHFITNVCAIIGGVFTVAGILDSIFHNTLRMVKKVELGKNI